MATDNRAGYGFRYAGARWGAPYMPLWLPVATSEAFNVTGGTSGVNLGSGDPVVRLSTGGVTLCAGAETTAVPPYGIVVAVGPYWDGARMQPTDLLPSATAWGTNLERQSFVGVIPIEQAYWEIDCDDNTTATTLAAYQAFGGENCDIRLNGGVSGTLRATNTSQPRAFPMLDISAHATTNSLKFRIVRVSDTRDNVDFAGNYVKMIVEVNITGTGGPAGLATTSTGI
jgi:hypothetical protein